MVGVDQGSQCSVRVVLCGAASRHSHSLLFIQPNTQKASLLPCETGWPWAGNGNSWRHSALTIMTRWPCRAAACGELLQGPYGVAVSSIKVERIGNAAAAVEGVLYRTNGAQLQQ